MTSKELKELTETLTVEEVLKEFEKLGYKYKKVKKDIILTAIRTQSVYEVIDISTTVKFYDKKVYYDGEKRGGCFDFKEHQLLTKLFKALGWFE